MCTGGSGARDLGAVGKLSNSPGESPCAKACTWRPLTLALACCLRERLGPGGVRTKSSSALCLLRVDLIPGLLLAGGVALARLVLEFSVLGLEMRDAFLFLRFKTGEA